MSAVFRGLMPCDPAEFGLDPDDCARLAGKPAEFLRIYSELREELLPVGLAELKILDEIVHYHIRIASARALTRERIEAGLMCVESDAAVFSENSKAAVFKEEYLIAERLVVCTRKRLRVEYNQPNVNAIDVEAERAKAVEDLRLLRKTASPFASKTLRATEAHCRREIFQLTAELRRRRKERHSAHYQKDKLQREAELQSLRSRPADPPAAPQDAPVAEPPPAPPAKDLSTEAAELLASTTAAFAATLLQAKRAEAEAKEKAAARRASAGPIVAPPGIWISLDDVRDESDASRPRGGKPPETTFRMPPHLTDPNTRSP